MNARDPALPVQPDEASAIAAFADAGVEHWHGAAHDTSAIFFQTTIGTGQTLWMEEVGRDDYMGNDVGLASRSDFLRTGVRQKTAAATKP